MADSSRALRGLFRLGARRRLLLGTAIAAGSLSAVLTLVPPVVVARLADGLLGPDPAATAVWALVGIAAAAIALRIVLLACAYVASHVAAFAILYDLRIALVAKLGRVPLGFVTGQSSGAVKKILGDDVDRIEGFIAHMLVEAAMALSASIAGAILLFWVDWRLALATLGPLPLAMVLQSLMYRGAGPMMASYVAASEAMNGALVQYLQGIGVIKAFGRGTYAPLDDGITRFRDLLQGFVRRTVPAWAAFQVVVKTSLLFLLPIGGWLAMTGRIPPADLLLALLVGLGLIPPLLTLMHAGGNLRLIAQGVDRIDAVLDIPDLPQGAATAAPADGSIVFDRVSFAYDGGDAALIDLSFTVPAGSTVALVGPSGAGKSTVAQLIARFWDVTAGTIRIGGADIRDLDAEVLGAHVAFVFQDVFLFRDSVRENLRLARPQASDDEIIAAARAAEAHDFIMRLPQGYDTQLGERGGGLSGGERQRLAIARALLRDAPILVLDEATAFADPLSEARIATALARLMRGRTVVVIAHRLSTITGVDRILVLDRGRLETQGRHDDLLTTSPLYRRLWQAHIAARDWQFGS